MQDKLHEAVVNLTANKVESNVRLGPFIHAPGDGEEIIAIEKAMMEDEGVKAEIAKLQLPEGAVVVSDPWIYGMFPEARTLTFVAPAVVLIWNISLTYHRLRWCP